MDVVLTVVAATAAEGELSSFSSFDRLFQFHGGYMFDVSLKIEVDQDL